MSKRLNKFGEELGELLEFQNISISDYADRINTTPKNLIDIIEGRVALSFNMICNISFISDIPVDYICNVEKSFDLDNKINNYINEHDISIRQFINNFNYKELKNKYKLTYKNDLNDYSIARSILHYLRVNDPKLIYNDNNHIFYKSNNDKPELLALWLERCYRVVQEQELKEYKKDNIYKLVEFIRNEAKNYRFDKERLIKKFNNNGIFLAVEPDLKGAKIRGAFRVLNNKPAIYITPKYKRYADIYFALLHELAHCKSDYNRAKNGSIVSFENQSSKEDYEIKADRTAYNWMVNDKIYDYIKLNNNFNEESEVPCFVVYRLAQDKIIKYNSVKYQKYNKKINNYL